MKWKRLTLNAACTSLHDQTNTSPKPSERPVSCWRNISNSLRSFTQASESLLRSEETHLDLALTFLSGTLEEAVDCDVIADLWSVGSVTMAPGVVAPATSPSTAAFSLLLVDRCFFPWFFCILFFICDLHHFKIPVVWARRFKKRLFKCVVIVCLLFATILTALSSCAILCNNTLENKNHILVV